MKLNLQKAVIITAFIAFSAIAGQTTPDTAPSAAPDKAKVSYALGMQMALEFKPAGADLDTGLIAQGIKDVLEGKPTRLQDAETGKVLDEARVNGLAASTKTAKG